MKKRTLKIRIIATVLSVVTIFSVTTASTVSAAAASTGDVAGDVAYAAGIGIIRQYAPGGQAIAGVLDTIINSFTQQGPSLSDISNDISALRGEISTQFADIKNQMKDYSEAIENKIVDQTVIAGKGVGFDKLMTELQATDRQINSINHDSSINDKEKAVEIACLIGKNSDWNKTSNLYYGYQDFMNTLSSSSFADQKDRDLYQVVYSDFASKVMFSGEALDKSKPYVDRVTLLGLYAYSINSQCLKAAQAVSQFTAEDEKMLNTDEMRNYYSVKSLTGVVNGEINHMNSKMFDTSKADSVAAHYNNYKSMSRLIFINKSTESKALTASMTAGNLSNIANNPNNLFNIMDKGALNHKELSDLAAYVKSAYNGKTLRDYLTYVGFDLTNVPKDARFVVGDEIWVTTEGYIEDFKIVMKKVFDRPEISIDDGSCNITNRPGYWQIYYEYVFEPRSSDVIICFNKA